jgi:hypothetical protein
MTVRGSCVPFDRLTALALAARAPESDYERQLLVHVGDCDRCAAALARLTADMDAMRDEAWREADALFDESALEAQRARILDRLVHLGQAARVLRFPARSREAAMPVSPISRRWISVAAAAGLIIGLVAGQVIHFVPWDTPLHRSTRQQPPSLAAPRGPSGPIIVQASSTLAGADDDLLDEIDQAMELRRAASIRALDAYTPRVGDLVEIH